jgi:hypothetical protein
VRGRHVIFSRFVVALTANDFYSAELEISRTFICTRVDSMKARIAAKRKRFEEGSLTEKQLIFYGEEWAEECIGSWSDDHVDEVQLRDLWDRQRGLCALSGQPMSTRTNDPNVGSVDRKDSRRGYTADNVQWVCAWVNYMKSSMPEGLFFQRCMTLSSRYTEWSLQKVLHHPPGCLHFSAGGSSSSLVVIVYRWPTWRSSFSRGSARPASSPTKLRRGRGRRRWTNDQNTA